jgi:hypothetical protein
MAAARLKNLGRTPEERVRWALTFRELDLGRLSERARHRAWAMLLTWQGGDPKRALRPGLDHRGRGDGVPDAQAALKQVIEALAHGEPHQVHVDETAWTIDPPPRRRPGSRRSGLIRMTPAARERSLQPVIPSAVVFAFVDALNRAEADRLRSCPLRTTEPVPRERGTVGLGRDSQHENQPETCGRIFLARRRQIFCGPKHAQAAAWQRYSPKRELKEAQADWERARKERRA